MLDAEFEKIRSEMIESLKEALADVEPVDEVPAILVFLMLAALYVWELLSLAVSALWTTIVKMVKGLISVLRTPFVGFMLFIDLALIMYWFFCRVGEKMCGGSK